MSDSESVSYDAIIIGAGIGGLNCAAMLAIAGKRVLVVERNNFIGGRCACYQKHGFTVDYGVHAFANGIKGPLHRPITAAINAGIQISPDILRWQRIYAQIKYKNSYVTTYLPLTMTKFWNYFRSGWSLMRLKAPFRDKMAFGTVAAKLKALTPDEIATMHQMSVKDLLDRYTDSQFVHAMMAISSDSYSVVPYDRVAASDFVDVYQQATRTGNISYPIGGCGAIPKAYQTIIEQQGGTILTHEPVHRILIEDRSAGPTAVGIKLVSGREFTAPIIVGNVAWQNFYRDLLGKSYLPEALVDKIDSLVPSFSSVVTHIALDTPLIKRKFVMQSSTLKPGEIHERRRRGEFVEDVGCFMPVVSNIDPNLAPPGKQLVLAGIGTSHENAHDKTKYQELILKNVQGLADSSINLADHIEWMDVMGPLELENLFGEKGAIVGIAQQIGQVRDQRISSVTPIHNLFHCGDDSGTNLFGVGTELAALSGQKCAETILSQDKKV
jgi:phytoene dehydrogenase-like protein